MVLLGTGLIRAPVQIKAGYIFLMAIDNSSTSGTDVVYGDGRGIEEYHAAYAEFHGARAWVLGGCWYTILLLNGKDMAVRLA